MPGYTASQASVDPVVVDGQTKDQTVMINYVPNEQQVHIHVVDSNGKIISDQVVSGHTGNKVSVQLPVGYQTANNQSAQVEILLDGSTTTISVVKIQNSN